MKHSAHILSAYKFDGKGGALEINAQDLEHLNKNDVAWIHLDCDHPESTVLLNHLQIDPIIISALFEEDTRPRLNEFEEGALIILRGVNLNENAEPDDMVSIRMFITPHRIISVRKRRLKAISDIREALKNGHGPKTVGQFIRALALRLCERMEPTLSVLDEQTDDVEELVLEEPDAELRITIVSIRKQAIMFKRYLAPQRDVLYRLRSIEATWLNPEDRRYLREASDRLTRYVEDMDSVRERTHIVQDELSNFLTDNLNRNTYMLSIVAAIFLPLGFLTGLLGINVGGIPGANNPNAFAIFIAILTIVVMFQVIIFRKLKWF